MSFLPANRKQRNQTPLDEKIEKSLRAYETASGGRSSRSTSAWAAAALATGIATLGLSQLADAEVVYTPANQQLPSFGTFQIDLNNDGIADVSLNVYRTSHIGSGYATFVVGLSGRGLNGNALEGATRFVDADSRGALIGSSDNFINAGTLGSCTNRSGPHEHHHHSAGLWGSLQVRYMGVKFSIEGETHYGWVRLRGVVCSIEPPFMEGYAYESVANKAIKAGPPGGGTSDATLGALAGGANALPLWKK